jgi:hypothetical protein
MENAILSVAYPDCTDLHQILTPRPVYEAFMRPLCRGFSCAVFHSENAPVDGPFERPFLRPSDHPIRRLWGFPGEMAIHPLKNSPLSMDSTYPSRMAPCDSSSYYCEAP